jgi:uncharacterized membrane protein YidH (DUF202 family)
MAMRVRFAIHRGKKISAVFHGGDERQEIELPDGWEELEPRKVLPNERDFDAWIRGDLDARLAGLTPPGFRPQKGIR